MFASTNVLVPSLSLKDSEQTKFTYLYFFSNIERLLSAGIDLPKSIEPKIEIRIVTDAGRWLLTFQQLIEGPTLSFP